MMGASLLLFFFWGGGEAICSILLPIMHLKSDLIIGMVFEGVALKEGDYCNIFFLVFRTYATKICKLPTPSSKCIMYSTYKGVFVREHCCLTSITVEHCYHDDRLGRDHMVIEFITTYAISAFHH